MTAPTTLRRHAAYVAGDKARKPLALPADHPAAVEGRTKFPSTVTDVIETPRLLIDGHNNRKIGRMVTKGPWKGMRIFTLTLEERATCPRTCHEWNSCMGNSMHWARRHRPLPGIEPVLKTELRSLQEKFPEGFVVRLHVLGDFFDVAYVRFWEMCLGEFPALHVFGYTAWPEDSGIGKRIAQVRDMRWNRFAVRTSVSEIPGPGPYATVTDSIGDAEEMRHAAVVCPVETGKTTCCGTCGLCWSPSMRDVGITFIRHGNAHQGRKAA
ncbi:MAG: hypothetical protein RIA64_01310 [Rhodospirillales bacterium]